MIRNPIMTLIRLYLRVKCVRTDVYSNMTLPMYQMIQWFHLSSQSSNAVITAMVPSQQEHADALGCYQSGNVSNDTIAPSAKEHADTLGCYQSGNPKNFGMVPYCAGHRGN